VRNNGAGERGGGADRDIAIGTRPRRASAYFAGLPSGLRIDPVVYLKKGRLPVKGRCDQVARFLLHDRPDCLLFCPEENRFIVVFLVHGVSPFYDWSSFRPALAAA
jgi:hypothetical protein